MIGGRRSSTDALSMNAIHDNYTQEQQATMSLLAGADVLLVPKEPFEFQPGSEYEYGFGLTVAGRIVEIASGKPFGEFVAGRILTPLGMKDTTWSPDAAQRERVARTYKLAGDKLVPAHNAFLTSDPDVKREAEPMRVRGVLAVRDGHEDLLRAG